MEMIFRVKIPRTLRKLRMKIHVGRFLENVASEQDISFRRLLRQFPDATWEENKPLDSLRSDFHFPPVWLGSGRTAATSVKLHKIATRNDTLIQFVRGRDDGREKASSSKYKRVNGSVCRPSGYLSRFSEIIPRIPWLTIRLVPAGPHECKDLGTRWLIHAVLKEEKSRPHFIKKVEDTWDTRV